VLPEQVNYEGKIYTKVTNDDGCVFMQDGKFVYVNNGNYYTVSIVNSDSFV